ncbi:hypothetical protein HLO79_003861 [Shigella flexneri]|nr:hypothetical protein [Shigella flexneri]
MPFYFRKECPLNSGYLKQRHASPAFDSSCSSNALYSDVPMTYDYMGQIWLRQ